MDRIEFGSNTTREEVERLCSMYEIVDRSFKELYAEWQHANEQRIAWHNYEQSLVLRRNAMQSVLSNLLSSIKELEKYGVNDNG